MGLYARNLEPIKYRSKTLGIAFFYPHGGRVVEEDAVLLVHPNLHGTGQTLLRVFAIPDRPDVKTVLEEMVAASRERNPNIETVLVTRQFGELKSSGYLATDAEGATETHVLRHRGGALVIKLRRGESTVIGRVELFRMFGETLRLLR